MLHGDVVAARATPRGSRAAGSDELVVVVQSDALDDLPTVMVAPVAGGAEPAPYRPEIVVGGQRVRVCCDRLHAVPWSTLGAIVARLDPDEQAAVDAAVSVVCSGEIRAPERRRG